MLVKAQLRRVSQISIIFEHGLIIEYLVGFSRDFLEEVYVTSCQTRLDEFAEII